MNYKPHCSVHQKDHIAPTPENSHQKHVVLVPFNDNEVLRDSGGGWWGEMGNLRLEDVESGRMLIKIIIQLMTSLINITHHTYPILGGYSAQTIEK